MGYFATEEAAKRVLAPAKRLDYNLRMPIYRSPAKVNLWLRILGRREDGFHEIETRMCPLDLHDEVELEPGGEGIRITCSDPEIPVGKDNLVWQAAEAFFGASNAHPHGLAIHLQKHIPSGAGLAGGSSNAATVLRALDELNGNILGIDGLVPLASRLGSDVAFFLHDGTCDCSGRGELVQLVKDPLPSLPLLLIRPAFAVSTPWAYRAWRDSGELPTVNYAAQDMPWGQMINDLERPVFARHLVLATIKQWLLSRSEVAAALMSGSGSTLFAVLKSESAGEALENAARDRYGPNTWIRRCRTLDQRTA